ncbi:DHA2 family efflux MFS transporter permease subunit [Actinomadura vinacea]|uniref:DHA2 family efflux MFS transporter permease subunit n=1 Tax=Actinomadura vinacea TaxID=115336 RepID=A0ABN3KI88_9ACTN
MTTSATSSNAPAPGPASRRRRLALVVMSLGVSLIVVDATIVGVLMPQIVSGLGLTTSDAEWVTSVYALVFAALLIPSGRAGDLFGRRRAFLAGVAVFAAASVVAALAQDGSALIGARALQGVGAAMLMPATLSTVNAMFTGRERAAAFGIWGSLIAGMAALGPLIGGAVASSAGWRWAFGVNLPLGLALIAAAAVLMPETRAPRPDSARGRGALRNALREIDWPGGALSALGLGALVCGLIEGQSYGWWTATRPFTMGSFTWPRDGLSPVPIVLGLAAVLLAALVVVERARAAVGRPVMLDLTLFRIPNFRHGNLASALINVGELGLVFVLPLFLLGVHGTAPLQISVALLPLAAGAFLSGGGAGRLANRYGAHRVVQLGMALEVAAVTALALTLTATTTGFGLAPWMLMYGFGLGLTSAQLTNVSLADVPPGQAGQASGTQSTARQVGAALGIALIGTVFATGLGHAMADRLRGTDLPAAQQAAIARELRESAGTYARDLHELADGDRMAAAADKSLTGVARGTDLVRTARPNDTVIATDASGGTATEPPWRHDRARMLAAAADASLAEATRRAVLATAAILALGLVLSLRLRPASGARPGRNARPARDPGQLAG